MPGRPTPESAGEGASSVYYYELHEGDDDLFHDIIVASERRFEPQAFFELVQAIRREIADTFEDDTLVEAIAGVLERRHGFIALTDERLVAAVNVSRDEEDNFLVDTTTGEPDVDYRGILVDFEPGAEPEN
jgi:hypothetical protein